MVSAKIHNAYKSLTATEQKIASYILKHPVDVASMSITELAQKCASAPSAVNRMCKSLGVEGFAKLKMSLAIENATKGEEHRIPSLGSDKDPCTIFTDVFNSGITTLKNTLRMLDFECVSHIAQKISKAQRVLIFGVGTSSVIASDAAYRFSQLGIQAYAYSDVLQMNVMAMNMKEGEVALGISHSGNTKNVVDAMRHAKDVGAYTVAISSFSRSILCKESDSCITVFPDEENYPIEAVSARIAHMCVADALMMTLAAIKYEDFEEHIAIRNMALEEMRY